MFWCIAFSCWYCICLVLKLQCLSPACFEALQRICTCRPPHEILQRAICFCRWGSKWLSVFMFSNELIYSKLFLCVLWYRVLYTGDSVSINIHCVISAGFMVLTRAQGHTMGGAFVADELDVLSCGCDLNHTVHIMIESVSCDYQQ